MGAAQDRDDIRAACAPKSAYDLLTMIMVSWLRSGCRGGEVPAQDPRSLAFISCTHRLIRSLVAIATSNHELADV